MSTRLYSRRGNTLPKPKPARTSAARELFSLAWFLIVGALLGYMAYCWMGPVL